MFGVWPAPCVSDQVNAISVISKLTETFGNSAISLPGGLITMVLAVAAGLEPFENKLAYTWSAAVTDWWLNVIAVVTSSLLPVLTVLSVGF